MTTSIASALDARRALDLLDAANDDISTAIRCLLIDIDESLDFLPECDIADIANIRALIRIIRNHRESLTTLLLDYSLCPLHAIDYAICFDDDDAECAQIRIIHPSHDT